MKLTDICATKESRIATAKLSRQVHKASVAAAKAPRLDLGVIGISIDQAQSTGLTSRVNESVDGMNAWELLERLGDEIGLPLVEQRKTNITFDKAKVADAAVFIMQQIGAKDKQHTSNKILQALYTIRSRTNGALGVNGKNMEALLNARVTLDSYGFAPFSELKTLLDAAAMFTVAADKVNANIEMIQEVSYFIQHCYSIATTNNKEEPHKVAFCRAALKHLGILH